jgi:hypothetical protein
MANLTVAARDVRVDDQLYMGKDFARNPSMRWANVHKIRSYSGSASSIPVVIITAGGIDNWFHPDEAVAIQRFDLS